MQPSSEKFLFPVQNVNLATTLTGGQAFRWRFESQRNTFVGVVGEDKWRVWLYNDCLAIQCLSSDFSHERVKQFAHSYFDLGRDYSLELGVLQEDILFKNAIDQIVGIRILRQHWFESIITFIVSANNNLKRISHIVENICKHYGTLLKGDDGIFYSFPTPLQLSTATAEDLRYLCNVGYRDKYIVQTVNQIIKDEEIWCNATNLNCEQLRNYLLKLSGIGPKVADCILLYGFGQWGAFPLDTWIRQIMIQVYFSGKITSDENIRKFAVKHFGRLAGLAQQYLFESARLKHRLVT